jgi:hypothetical protein
VALRQLKLWLSGNADECVNIGANPMLGVTAAHDATIRAANATYQLAKQTTQVTKAATEQTAKDTLANTGDVGPR